MRMQRCYRCAAITTTVVLALCMFASSAPAQQAPAPKQSVQSLRKLVDLYEKDLGLKQEAYNKLRKQQVALRAQVVELCGLSPENVATELLGLEKTLFSQRVEIDLAEARQKLLAQYAASEEVKLKERLAKDGVLQKLEVIAALKQDEAEAIATAYRHKEVSVKEAMNSKAEMANAQVQVELRKEELAKASGSKATADKYVESAIERVQADARYKHMKEQLDMLSKARAPAEDYLQLTKEDLPRAAGAIERRRQQLENVKDRLLEMESLEQ